MHFHFTSFYLFSALVLLSLLPFALSIKCWICHSDSDPKCADPFDNTTLPIRDCREIKKSHLFATETGYDALLRKENETKGLPIAARKLLSATMCRKIRQKIHGNWRTIRDCAFLGSPGEGTGNEHHCLYRRGTYDVYLEYCTCNSKDGCNLASNLAPRLPFVLLGFAFAYLLVR